MSGDPMYGGNVAPVLEGMPVADRLSFYYRSTCHVTLPGHADGSVLARADTTDEGSMRDDGCPIVVDRRG